MTIAEQFTVLTGTIAVAAFLGTVPPVARLVLETRMWSAKTRIARSANRMARRTGERPRAMWAAWVQAGSLTRGVLYTAADELQWLTDAVGTELSVTFSDDHRADSEELARRYRRYAATLRTRAVLLGSSQPLLDRVATVAEDVAGILAVNADHRPVGTEGRVSVVERQITTGYVSVRPGTDRSLSSVLLLEELSIDGRFTDHHVEVSWLQEQSRNPRTPRELDDQPREYNGLLPRLMAHRYERDHSSGNYRLHLQVGEIYYSEHKECSAPGARVPKDPDNTHGGLLTLSVLPVTSDGHLILAKRGRLSFYPECWGPGAGGNLEILRSGRNNPDADPHGVIDPLRAVVRELREEIGLSVSLENVRSLGLARLSNSEENGTWLWATSAATSLSLPELTRTTINADPVDGRWEVGDELAAVPVPRSSESAEVLLSWALRNPRVMPHLAVGLVKLIAAEWALEPRTVTPRASDAERLPPGGRSFAFGRSFEADETPIDR